MLLEIQISSSLLLTSANKGTFFISQVLLGVFFSQIMLESLGCGLYTSLYGICAITPWIVLHSVQLLLLILQNSNNLLHCVLHVKVHFLLKTVGKVQESSLVQILFKNKAKYRTINQEILVYRQLPISLRDLNFYNLPTFSFPFIGNLLMKCSL